MNMLFYPLKDERGHTALFSPVRRVSAIFRSFELSGFVGILHFDGSPVDFSLLRDLTNFLSFRGPDAQDIWRDGALGLGHALLQTTTGSALEKQPAQLDGRLWIAADARIDARAELIGKLKGKSQTARALSLSTPDAELILHAYHTWGESCVEHLLGDFSFALWDARENRLFCARDQMGVKPFYYAQMGPHLVFSNTLDCIRRHPDVSSRLNDLAIADFLLFDFNQDPATTSFAHIQRLPPAHVLSCVQGKVSIRRYWELSVTTPIQYSSDPEYVEHFRELLDTAVADRLRTENVGVQMSGGLDSSTVAASAQRVMARSGRVSGLRACTQVFDSLIPDKERHYASLVADALKIPIEFVISDHWKIFERADLPEYHTTEPMHSALPNAALDQLRQIAAYSRVDLTGYGGDPALCGRISIHFRKLIETKQFGRALSDAARFLTAQGRFSRLYLRERWSIMSSPNSELPVYPGWLNEDFERRLDLRARWKSLGGQATLPLAAVRPEAQEGMTISDWPNLFEMYDAGRTRILVEARHPIFDLRLLNFLLALPRLPWCSDKELLREAGRGQLPDAVRLRRKSPLAISPLNAILQLPESAWVDRFQALPELEPYVMRNRIPSVFKDRDPWTAWIHLRPLSLNFWLRSDL